MIRFIDFEASSLLPGSYPIEVAWVDEGGQGESYLIRPDPEWLMPEAWSRESQAIHGISMDVLMAEGVPAERVAARAFEVLRPLHVMACSDQPAFDGFWLDVLLELIDLPPGEGVRLIASRHLYGLACARLAELIPPMAEGVERTRLEQRARALGAEIVARAEEVEALRPRVHHRALPDAESLWRTWRAIKDEVARVCREGWP